MIPKRLLRSAMVMCVGAATCIANAQTVTVAKTGSPTYSTVQAALNHFTSDPDPNTSNVVQITDSAVYDEMLTMNVPVDIIGTGASRPVLAVQANPAGFDNDGTAATNPTAWAGDAGLLINIPVEVTSNALSLRNLIIIPSKTGTPPIAGIVNKANNLYIDMENILVTGNNGSDAPISTDGLSSVPTDPLHVHFLVSGAHLGSITNNRPEGDGVEVRLRNCVFTNIRSSLGDTWRSGFYMYRTYYVSPVPPAAGEPTRPTAYRHLRVEEGCKFTYNNGDGLRCAAGLEIYGTPEEPILFVGNGYNGLWMDMIRGANYGEHLIIANNGRIGINEGVGSAGPRMNIKDVIIANNGWYGTYHRLGSAAQTTSTLERVTIANNSIIHTGTSQIQSSTAASLIDIYMKDVIVTGDSETTKSTNIIDLQAQGEFTIENTAIVTEGPFALYDPPIKLHASGVQTGTPVTNADPQFKNTTDPLSHDFYDVQNSAYATLSSTGGPLAGGADFAGVSTVSDWSVY